MEAVIYGGHFWALGSEYPGVFETSEVDKRIVSEVVNILDRWRFIEASFAKMTKKQRDELSKSFGWAGKDIQFLGFDHQNNEFAHLSVARFYIDHLDTFSFLKGRDLDAHHATLHIHRSMYATFDPMRGSLIGRELSFDELMAVLKARR